MFHHRITATPDRPAYQFLEAGAWKTINWRQTGELVRNVASGLKALGLKVEERVSILASTRVEWILADLGIVCAGGATTTIYPSSKEDECAYIISDSASAYVIAENEGQLKKLQAVKAQIPSVRKVILLEGKASDDGWAISWEDLLKQGAEFHAKDPASWETVIKAVKPNDLCTLIYTSGTTGKPKGVELTQDAWVFEGEGVAALQLMHIDDIMYLWLPMAHSFGKVLEAIQLQLGLLVAIDGRIDKIVENLGVLRPTVVPAVPRIFEKVYNRVIQQAKEAGGAKWKIFQWAVDVGLQVTRIKQDGGQPGALLAAQYKLADKLVFVKIRNRFGGRIRVFVSGSAPLSRQIAEWFYAAGLMICEGYGLTESAAASFVNRPESVKFGTVGPPVTGVKIKIAEDGEILLHGRGIMRGYHNMPKETAEALDSEGWLHTGDIGELDPQGRLRITDRKKELIKTSGGKYVAPGAMESRFKSLCPYVSQMVVHGDNRNFCSALLAFDEETLRKWATAEGVTGTYAELGKNPKVIHLFQGYIDQLNKEMPSYSTIKKFVILPKDLTEADGDLTPSQKLKRKAVEKKFKDLLDQLYVGAVAGAD